MLHPIIGSKRITVSLVALIALFPTVACAQAPKATTSSQPLPATKTRLAAGYARLPLAFEPNVGQVGDKRVRFLTHTGQGTLFLTNTEAVLTLPYTAAQAGPTQGQLSFGPKHRLGESKPRPHSRKIAVVRMRLMGAQKLIAALGLAPLPGMVNYFRGNDPKQWHTHIPTYRQARFDGVYQGVDMLYYGTQGGKLEYDFVVKPGANPRAIRLAFSGATRARVTAGGELRLHTAAGEVCWQRPVTYQILGGRREAVACAYELNHQGGKASVGFRLARYDTSRPVVIDPTLQYSTFLGGSGNANGAEEGMGITVDSSGNAYVTGTTYSADFPTTKGAFQTTNTGYAASATNAFVTKLNATGSALTYSTFLGGSGVGSESDQGNSIAVDGSGAAYVTGVTYSSDFPTTTGAYQTTNKDTAGGNAFVTKLSANGASLVYSTCLGGSGNSLLYGNEGGEEGASIAVDHSGNAYITGSTYSNDFPTTTGALQTANNAYAASASTAFLTKLNTNGSALVYSTFLGGSGNANGGDQANGIAIDTTGNAYITGSTYSTDFPTTKGALQTTNKTGNNETAFLAKLNAAGAALVYSTYLGGSGMGADGDQANAIAIDGAGNAYVTGFTYSTDFPTTKGAFQTTNKADSNGTAFLTKLNAGGSALIYSTFLGGSGGAFGGDAGTGIALDSSGNACVTGWTYSADFPVTAGAFQTTNNAYASNAPTAFVTKLIATGSSLLSSTFLGGSGFGTDGDAGNAIALDSSGNAYVTGLTYSSDFPTTKGAFQTTNKAGSNGTAFVARLMLPMVKGDFFHDGNGDLVFQNNATGQVALWDLNGTTVLAGALINATPNAGYAVVGTGDFNGDGNPDVVFQNQSTGQIAFWYMNGTQVLSGALLARIPSPGYKVVGIGDFNGDGLPDFLFQNQTTGQLAVWYMNGSTYLGGGAITDVPYAGYPVAGVGDFNNDGNPDILFQNAKTGQLVVWYMSGITHTGGAAFSQSPIAGWQARAVADFNHDGSPDIAFQNQASGQVVIWYLNQISVIGGGPTNLAPSAGFLIAGPR